MMMTHSPSSQALSVRHEKTSGAAGATTGNPVLTSAFEQTLDCDICIVGADLAGLLMACDLASRGYEVALCVMAEDETSGLDSAFAPGFDLSTPELVARLGREDARALLELSVSAAQKGMAYVTQAGLAPGPRGRLAVAGPRAADALMAEHEAREALLGHASLLLNAQDTQALLGTTAFSAALGVVPANRVDVAALRSVLLAAARESDVHILDGTQGLATDLANPRKCVDVGKVRVRTFGVVFSGGLSLGKLAPSLIPALVPLPHVRGVFQVGEDEEAYQGLVEEYGATGLRFYRQGQHLHMSAETALMARTDGWAGFALRRHARVLGSLVTGQAPQHVRAVMLARTREQMPVVYEGVKGVWYCATLGDEEPTHGVMAADMIVAAITGQDDRVRLLQPFGLASATQRPVGRMETIVSYGYARLSKILPGKKTKKPKGLPATPPSRAEVRREEAGDHPKD